MSSCYFRAQTFLSVGILLIALATPNRWQLVIISFGVLR